MPETLTDATKTYLESLAPETDDLLLEMEVHAEEEGVPIAAREVAHLQAMLARTSGAERAIEFGTGIGYSTIQVARTGCEVVTLELDPERIAAAEEYIARAGVEDRVTIVEGPALETLPDQEGPFDLAFLDAVKTEYGEYLDGVLPMLANEGVVIADNLLWQGQVPTGPIDEDWRESTEALRAFNERFTSHPDLDAVVLALGDGTGIGVKR